MPRPRTVAKAILFSLPGLLATNFFRVWGWVNHWSNLEFVIGKVAPKTHPGSAPLTWWEWALTPSGQTALSVAGFLWVGGTILFCFWPRRPAVAPIDWYSRPVEERVAYLSPLFEDLRQRGRHIAALVDLVEFALFTGVRKSEALDLTWDRVDRARGVIRLEVTKSGHRREVPLSANADAVLARRWSDGATGYVFGTKNWYAFQTAWLAALRRAKIDGFRFHDLRHTFASWLVQRGRSLKEVQDALGHRTLAMTLRYSHLAPEHLRAAVAVLDDVLPAGAQVGHKLQRVTEAPQTISS